MQDTVQSVDRALNILELLSSNDSLGVTEIGKKLNLHKSTAHRLLLTLITNGYVKQNMRTNNYELTLKMFELGHRVVENIDMVTVAQPYLKQLMERTNEVVHLGVRENSEIIYLAKVEAPRSIKIYSRVGMRKPMYCTAMGKVILANLSHDDIELVWRDSHVEKMTEFTIVSLSDLKKNLDDIRKFGYGLDNQEVELGIKCIGAPIFDYRGLVCGAISISCSTFSLSDEKEQYFIKLVIEYAKKISLELGSKR